MSAGAVDPPQPRAVARADAPSLRQSAVPTIRTILDADANDDAAVTCSGACPLDEKHFCPASSPVCCGPCSGYYCCGAGTSCCGAVPGNITCCPYGNTCDSASGSCKPYPVVSGCAPFIVLSRLAELSRVSLSVVVAALALTVENHPCPFGPFAQCDLLAGDCVEQVVALPPYHVENKLLVCPGACVANGTCAKLLTRPLVGPRVCAPATALRSWPPVSSCRKILLGCACVNVASAEPLHRARRRCVVFVCGVVLATADISCGRCSSDHPPPSPSPVPALPGPPSPSPTRQLQCRQSLRWCCRWWSCWCWRW